MNNILVRSLSGGIYIAILIVGVLFYSQLAFLVFGAILYIALFEFGKLISNKGYSLDPKINIGFGLLIYLIFMLSSLHYISILWLGTIPFILIAPLVFSLFQKEDKSLFNGLITVAGYIYILLPLVLVHFLYSADSDGKIIDFWPVLGMMILTWTSDTFAYLSGRFFGKTKLFERISPKKTWEGVFGGMIFSVLGALVIAYFDDQRGYGIWILLGLLVPVVGVMGDLFESLIKRTVGVKDSGDFIPGHGGILDRIDAMLFTIPLTLAMIFIYTLM
jgi:phosphatidate cytidylyltransferase